MKIQAHVASQTRTYAVRNKVLARIHINDHNATELGGSQHTRINLLDLRQRQPHLIPVHSRTIRLQRIPLEIHRLQLLLILQLALDLVKARELVIRRPQLLQILQCAEVLEVGELVVGEV
jgi:hypothetical protein